MDVPDGNKNTITFTVLGAEMRLASLLKFEPPPFREPDNAFVQLRYLEDYIRRPDLTSSSQGRIVAIESHYTDRDFMADHSVLFASILTPPVNYCTRLHFFAGDDPQFIERTLIDIGGILGGGTRAEIDYANACREFSEKYYLGFAVIRPLAACRVGRTVLRLLPEVKEDGSRRMLLCVRDYESHFMAVNLTVRGLAFQQQDLGVSRCATIALWCALHKTGDGEVISHVTPAEITNLASRYRLPFGRPMPSEGLAVDQMCLALQTVGVSPFLAKVTNFLTGRSLIYSAALSGAPSILILQQVGHEDVQHAVTVMGIKLAATDTPDQITWKGVVAGDDASGSLRAAYVQDDRIGPYRRAEITESDTRQLRVRIKTQSHVATGKTEDWTVTHILIPLHPKIRISFNDLRYILLQWIIPHVHIVTAAELGLPDFTKPPKVVFRYWIERGFRYIQRVIKEQLLSPDGERRFRTEFVLPRYVAVLRLTSTEFGAFDIVVDTTSPKPNFIWLAVLSREADDSQGRLRHTVAEYIAEQCSCQLLE